MEFKTRPSFKELNGKIVSARASFASRGYVAADLVKLSANFNNLQLYGEEEMVEALQAALHEIAPKDYAGQHPPTKSYEPKVQGLDLFAFEWDSSYFGQVMYFKYCLHSDGTLYIISLHVSKVERRRLQ